MIHGHGHYERTFMSLLAQERGLQCAQLSLWEHFSSRSSRRSVGCNSHLFAKSTAGCRRSSRRSVGCNSIATATFDCRYVAPRAGAWVAMQFGAVADG